MRDLALVGLILLLGVLPVVVEAALPEGWQATGNLQPEDGWLIADGKVEITAPLPDNTATELKVRMGKKGSVLTLQVHGPDEQSRQLLLDARDECFNDPDNPELTDAAIRIIAKDSVGTTFVCAPYFIRPTPRYYAGDDQKDLLERWDELPPASQQPLTVRIERSAEQMRFWVEDRFIAGWDSGAGFETMTITMSKANALGPITTTPFTYDRRFLPIALASYRRPSESLKSVTLEPGVGRLDGIPLWVAAPGDSVDVGVSRWLNQKGGLSQYSDQYFARSAFDNNPESIIFDIPTDDYSYAHLLCAVDPDLAKTPALTLRLCRYRWATGAGGGRGEAIADTEVRIEQVKGKWPEWIRPLPGASARIGGQDVPLLHAVIPIRGGQIQDLLEEPGGDKRYFGKYWRCRSTHHLNLELTKELHQIMTSVHSHHSMKPLGKPSGVQVVGLTLERAPVKVRVRQEPIAPVFYHSEQPAFRVEMTPLWGQPFTGTLAVTITDFEGNTEEQHQPITVPAAVEQAPYTYTVDLDQPDYGWYKCELRLTDEQGRYVWEQPTAFVILPPDTRKAGNESPYSLWWFRTHHGGTASMAEMGPLFRKLGIRHTTPGRGGDPPQDEMTPYGVTPIQIQHLAISRKTDHELDLEKAEAAIATQVVQYPNTKWALVFHEHGWKGAAIGIHEFLGKEPPKLTEAQQAHFQRLFDQAVALSQLYREKAPDIKLVVGNSGLSLAQELMRQGYPKEYVDAFGDEDAGQKIMPEYPPAAFKSIFWLKEYAKLYGYDVPVTACLEWRHRGTEIGNLSGETQAQLYARDMLHGLAFRMPHICPGQTYDTDDAYYYSRWGSTGVMTRYPLLTPKPSFAAMATLTQQLDQAEFVRYLPTGSPTLYCMQFKNGDGFVYVLWLPRGERPVTLRLARDAEVTHTNMVGKQQKLTTKQASLGLEVSASPCYVVTSVPLSSVEYGPTRCEPPPAGLRVVDSLADPPGWAIAQEPEPELHKHFDLPRLPGKIDRRPVADPEKKRALELTLQLEPDIAWPYARYIVLEAKDPQPIPGEPTAIGVWVKGNSCWGQLFWEFEDAQGERFLSVGASAGGWSVGDWRALTFINFDGWNYLSVKLPFRYENGHSGPTWNNWKPIGEGDRSVDHPIKLTRLIVALRDHVVHLTDMISVPDTSVRLKDLSVSYEPFDY